MASSPAATTLGAAAEAPQAGAREEERLPEDGAPEGPAPAAREGPGRGGEASAELSPIVEIPETPRSVQEVVKTPRSTQEAREASPRQEVDSSTPTTIPDGVCKVCAGAKVLRTELTHNCTNCSGKGYCAASSGGNRFVCTFCKGTGQVSSTAERSCEACAGTGCSRTLLDSMPQPDPLEKIRPERGDSLDKVKFEDQTLVLENLALSMSCLLNFLGLVLLIVGFALLVGRLWFMAGIVLAAGVVCLAFAVAQRLRRLWMAGKASRGGSSSPSDQPSPLEDQPSLGRPDPEASAPLSFDHLVGMATLAALPNVFVVYFLSDIGIGLKVYSFVAPQHMNLLGDLIVSIASLTIGALAVFDWLNWTTVKRVCSASVPLVLLAIGSLFKGRKYSWAPILMVLFLIPLGLGLLRTYSCRSVRRASFYKAAGVCMMLNAVVLLVVWFVWIALGNNEWNDETKLRLRLGSSIYEYVYSEHPLDYDRHCGPSKNLDALSRDDRREVSAACSTAATVLFLVYSSPFVAFACNGVMASFCFLERVARDSRDLSRLQQALQLFGAALAAGTACFYASVYLSSASFRLGSTLLAFLAAGFVALLVWGFLEIGDRRLMEHLAKSESSRLAMQIWAWDLAKAGVLIGFNVLIPIGFFLSMLNMKVRRWRKRPNSEARFTPTAEWILAELVTWRWASVLCKACLVAEFIFTMQVGVAKVTYILLSWLNSQLAGVGFGLVVVLAVLVGYTMFMLPPVPGVPVYVFVGIVISERGRSTPGVGFAGGVVIALLVSFIMKQIACLSQYMIGYCLGKSVKVQQLVGVDKVFTRAVEAILKEPALSFGKVAILVGGPDWPTSVICGILRLNVPRMVWGTCPVVVVIGPCVLAGAFLSRVSVGEESIWNLLADAAIGLAAFVNGASFLAAAYKIAVVALRRGHELARPRPEHAKVAELSRRREARLEAYREVVDWKTLHPRWKAFIAAAAVMQLGSLFAVGMMYEACFRDFSISSDINADLPDGLGGNPLKIVREPLGWFPLGIFAAAVLMHIVFGCRMSRLTTIRLRGKTPSVDTVEPAGVQPPPLAGESTNVTEAIPAGHVAAV